MKNSAIVLMYHNIGVPPKGAALRSLYVTPRMFRFQMWYLKAAGFKVASIGEILSFMSGGVSDKRLVAITFDDGYQDFYDNAYPVLRRYGYPSTIFLVSDLVGKYNLWDDAKSGIMKRLMGWDKILEISSNGVEIGSHTRSHPFLTKLSDMELSDEITGSREALEDILKKPVELFCYPYGDYDNRVSDAVMRAGYLGAVTIKRGLVHKGYDPFEIRRSFIRHNTHPLLFMYKLHSSYEDKKGSKK